MKKILYASLVRSMMYAMVCTKPNIAYVVRVVSRFMRNPDKEHWSMIKWILRYLKGTSNMCLLFSSGKLLLEGYTNLDMSANVDTSRSTSGYVMTYAGGVVSWQSRLLKVMALSTTEAKYTAAVEAGKEIIWMKEFIGELGI